MSDKAEVNQARRNILIATTCAGGAATVAAAVPFVASMLPSERAKAIGAPVEADISYLAPGEMMRVEWRGQPVWIVHRTKEMLDAVKAAGDKVADPKSERKPSELTPEYARNEFRSIAEYLVVVDSRIWLFSVRPLEGGSRGVRSGMEGRLLLSLPWLAVRSCGTRLQEQTSAG
jgi:ubiquinol-cytochrome c reductase iron-sulfur subunit